MDDVHDKIKQMSRNYLTLKQAYAKLGLTGGSDSFTRKQDLIAIGQADEELLVKYKNNYDYVVDDDIALGLVDPEFILGMTEETAFTDLLGNYDARLDDGRGLTSGVVFEKDDGYLFFYSIAGFFIFFESKRKVKPDHIGYALEFEMVFLIPIGGATFALCKFWQPEQNGYITFFADFHDYIEEERYGAYYKIYYTYYENVFHPEFSTDTGIVFKASTPNDEHLSIPVKLKIEISGTGSNKYISIYLDNSLAYKSKETVFEIDPAKMYLGGYGGYYLYMRNAIFKGVSG